MSRCPSLNFPYRKLREYISPLRDIGYSQSGELPRLNSRNVMSIEDYATPVQSHLANDALEQRRLTDTVRSDDQCQLAGAGLHCHPS